VAAIDPRLRRATALQLKRREAILASGGRHVGWKLGLGDAERIGAGPVVGHLTSATELQPGATYRAKHAAALHADAELALELGSDIEPDADAEDIVAAIACCGAALELVDLERSAGGAEEIIAGNVFHRAFCFGDLDRDFSTGPVEASLIVNGDRRGVSIAAADQAENLAAIAGLLSAFRLSLCAGDRLITGAIVQAPVAPGDEICADLGTLGRTVLRLAD
jgi:2-keto-4-pentenoate hydratase